MVHFPPSGIPGLAHWYDAADPGAIELDSGWVAEWRDKAPGQEQLRSCGAGGPRVAKAALNGCDVLRFSPGQRLSTSFGTPLDRPYTIFVVFKADTAPQPPPTLLCVSAGRRERISICNGGRVQVATAADGSGDSLQNGPRPLEWQLLTLTLHETSSHGYISGLPAPVVSDLGVAPLDGLVIGQAREDGPGWSGCIAEILIYRGRPTPAGRRAVERHLSSKYGIPVFEFPASRVWILSGQSNALGTAVLNNLALDSAAEFPQAMIYNYFKGRWEDIQFTRGRANNLAAGRGRFGPELTFLRDCARSYPDEKVYLLKCGFGGKYLANDVLTNSFHPNGGHVFAYLTAIIDAAFEKLLRSPDSRIDPHLQSVLWMQGESDCTIPRRFSRYERNLSAFIGSLRRHLASKGWGERNIPFIVGEIGHIQQGRLVEGAWAVRDAQRRIASLLPRVLTVNTEAFPVSPDGVHFDHRGQQMLGSAFFEAAASVLVR